MLNKYLRTFIDLSEENYNIDEDVEFKELIQFIKIIDKDLKPYIREQLINILES